MRFPTFVLLACLTLAGGGVGGCGGANSGPGGARPDPRRWLTVDATKRRIAITLVVAYDNAASGLNLDGAFKGALLFRAPVGWKVTVRCVNNANATRYACALLPAPGGGRARLPNAANLRTAALQAGGRASFEFAAGLPGAYRLSALLGGQPASGMWVALDVAPGGQPEARWLR